MDVKSNEAVEIDIKELFSVLLHKIWIIIMAGIVGAIVIGLINQYMITPIYTSTTSIYVIHRQDESKTTYSDLQSGAQLTQDYMILVTSRPVMEKVIENLGIDDMSPGELADMIYIVNPDGTRILEISVVNSDPVLAKQLADEIANVSSEQMVNIMEIKKINIVEYGNIPSYPSSPDVTKNTIFGGLAGVVVASLAIIIVHMMNDNIRTADDIEKHLGITTLGVIPLEEGNRKKRLHRSKQIKSKAELAS
ncbi:polysaccharide export protein [Mobilitalea sibirica]|uniref:Polysaccharide export protein n=1 Tax=Mobilitalea sibirica TaxID=1462919 RepID=A0A8J7H078_9FIRM|nr:Wzz/FepE/Etk N-terminal domain-containing protein [Mobilitalea sibirica]MBH1939362.1 polysaccharide export protein [Mobilitalea sibirica]